jgi:hypothetical protein
MLQVLKFGRINIETYLMEESSLGKENYNQENLEEAKFP